MSGSSFHENNKTCQSKMKIEGNKEKSVNILLVSVI